MTPNNDKTSGKEEKCRYCGKVFLSVNGAKYCSDLCRALIAKERDHAKTQTDEYKEYQRQYRERRKRAIEEAKAERDRLKARQIATVERETKDELIENAKRDIESSNPFKAARGYITLEGKRSVKYWETVQKLHKMTDTTGVTFVNGISVDDPEFVEKVIESINEFDLIRTEYISFRNLKTKENGAK